MPSLGVNELAGNVEGYRTLIEALKQRQFIRSKDCTGEYGHYREFTLLSTSISRILVWKSNSVMANSNIGIVRGNAWAILELIVLVSSML